MGVTARLAPVTPPVPLLQRLSAAAGQYLVASCYVPLAVDAGVRRGVLREFRQRLRAATHEPMTDNGTIRAALDRDLRRLDKYFAATADLPRAGGVAAFACEAIGLWETIPLPRVHRPRLVVDHSAFVRELVELDVELGLVYAVVFDRPHARLFEVTAFEAAELPGLPGEWTRGSRFRRDGQDSPGSGERNYHNRIARERERHSEEIARGLRQLDHARHAQGIVLAAPGPQAAALVRFLDPDLARRVLGNGRLSPKTAVPRDVFALTARLRHERELADGQALTARMREQLGNGWAVNGTQPTLDALFLGKVQTLLVAGQLERPGFRCSSGRLVTTAAQCRPGEGPLLAVPDVIDDAIEEALRQHTKVVVVPEGERVIGLGAILRFR